MQSNPFTPGFGDLPDEMPIFPLPGVAVMPGVQLPLNIFEPRYLSMVFDVLGSHRMIGMVQPEPGDTDQRSPRVYRTGTAGRITSFSETKNGRIMIVLTGICRFDIAREVPSPHPYRVVNPDWSRFATDYESSEEIIADRSEFFRALRAYCDRREVEIAWDDTESLADQALVDLLTVHLPLDVPEKQALIESVALRDRIQLLRGLLEIGRSGVIDRPAIRH